MSVFLLLFPLRVSQDVPLKKASALRLWTASIPVQHQRTHMAATVINLNEDVPA